jgi:hypothetical protein
MEFQYLGSLTSNNKNSTTVEVNHRILLGNRCCYGLRNLLLSRLLNEGTVTNSQVLFHNGSLLHSKFNTQLLITVHNSSRILTQVQLLPVL